MKPLNRLNRKQTEPSPRLDPQPCLGNCHTLDELARKAAQEFCALRLLSSRDETVNVEENIGRILSKYSDILLGKRMNYRPVPGWNVDGGGLPRNVSRRWSLAGNSAEVVKGGLSFFFQDLLQAERMADEGLEFEYVIDAAIELQVAVWSGTDHIVFPE